NIANYQGTEDTTILNNGGTAANDQNFGGRGNMFVGATANGDAARHLLIRFNVAPLQNKYLSIDGITLRLYPELASTAANSAQLFRLKPGTGVSGNGEWVEGVGVSNNQAVNSASWSHKKYNTTSSAGSFGA